jgi:hypothetical protein
MHFNKPWEGLKTAVLNVLKENNPMSGLKMASVGISYDETQKVSRTQGIENGPYTFITIPDYKVRGGVEQTTSETFHKSGTHKP